ncbi:MULTISPECIES: ABC transporter substrate-binding protein [unclassified Kitasatospora]|uniref:ABC transporter substrate-binding protein n=1 Tax=unclassified Kitasatospora TaxID=2633591 RepID=UPI00070EDC73|nr:MULTISPECIES: ABC transporter substrate-binding protein [unclassified Kitasatospora]KQV04626.1 peptide ABC transporter substrate-binding protein [Kitasatospora sp. Root107]KRB60849.1 peptide ABC transporter substrate-binding protein [Kitasatospora sp. Root187]
MTSLSRRSLLRGSVAAAGLLSLAACRSAAESGDGAAASAGPRRGGTLSLATTIDYTPSLLFAQSANTLVQRLVFNTLTRYDDQLRPQPELATSWQPAADGRSITFKLRDDVLFHDGRKFTADDVIFAVKNLQNPVRSAQLRSTAATVTEFRKNGDHELTLELAHPVSNLFDLFEFMIITDSATVEDAVAGKQLIGTGPFRYGKRTPGSSITFTRNEKYWNPGRPYLDGVEIRVIPQADSLVSSLKTGQSHLSYHVPGKDLAGLKGSGQFQLRPYDTGSGAYYIGVNVSAEQVKDKRVRQAISWAVDRERLVQQALGGYGLPSAAPWPKSSPAYSDANATHYRHDPAKARELLKEAGVSGLTLPFAHSNTPDGTAIAQILQHDLKQVGIETELQPTDSPTMQKQLISQTMPALWTLSHGFAQLHPATLAVSAYPFNEAKNSSHFSSPGYTDIVQRAWKRPDSDSAEAKALYQQVTDTLLDEAFVIDLAIGGQIEVAGTKVHGATLNKFNYLNLDDAYLTV